MEEKIKVRLLQSIGKVYEESKGCKLESSFVSKVEPEMAVLTNYFGVNNFQAQLVAVVFALNYKRNCVDINDIIEYLDCNPIKLLEYSDDFELLYKMGILRKIKNKIPFRSLNSNEQFCINETIKEAVVKSLPMPTVEVDTVKDVYDLLEEFYEITQNRNEDEMNSNTMVHTAYELFGANLHFPLIKAVRDLDLSHYDEFLLFYIIWIKIKDDEATDIETVVDEMYDRESRRVNFTQTILNGDNELIAKNIVNIVEGSFLNDTKLELSASTVKMIQDLGVKFISNKSQVDNLIHPEMIFAKPLFYNDLEASQLKMVGELLQNDNLQAMQSRMAEKGFPIGVPILLHGAPGTGKTESVYQLAKATNRSIMKVEISQSKSMWFGESEKKMKRIFTDYKNYKKECELTPILFFNEADALISKRKDSSDSNVAQTENTIQNIILEELENFDGIFFATTNLVKNMDLAFERRFLYKIEFNYPAKAVKMKIWNSKLPHLSESECDELSQLYDFSGGQIDNIVRKKEIYEIINNQSVDFTTLKGYCDEELLAKKRKSTIGF